MFRERERERERQRRLFKQCQNLSAGHCAAGVQLFKWRRNLSAEHCAAGAVSQPICRHCVAKVQLFKWCRNLSAGQCAVEVQLFKQCGYLSAGTVLQGCSCLSGVETYLPALCCRGATVKAVSQTICLHCAAVVQLFKWCRNLSAGTVLQGCSCLSGVKTYLQALCCRCAAV